MASILPIFATFFLFLGISVDRIALITSVLLYIAGFLVANCIFEWIKIK